MSRFSPFRSVPNVGDMNFPPGWEMRYDPETNWPYYIDHINKTTTWHDPRIRTRDKQHFSNSPLKEKNIKEIPVQPSINVNDQINNDSTHLNHYPMSNVSCPFNEDDFRDAKNIPIFKEDINVPKKDKTVEASGEPPSPFSNLPTIPSDVPIPLPSPSHPPQIIIETEIMNNINEDDVKDEMDRMNLRSQSYRGRSPSPAPPNLTALEVITLINKELEGLTAQVKAFKGKKSDKEYLLLEEMLTRLLIKLDRVESDGNAQIRIARKDAVSCIQSNLDLLEKKLP